MRNLYFLTPLFAVVVGYPMEGRALEPRGVPPIARIADSALASSCPQERDPVPVNDPRLVQYWAAATAFSRTQYGFSALPTSGDVMWESHPSEGYAVLQTCQLNNRVYRTIHFRLDAGPIRWIGEQQVFRSGRTYEHWDAGNLLEELVFDFEIERVAGFPLNQINIVYHGPDGNLANRSKPISLDEAHTILRTWGFGP